MDKMATKMFAAKLGIATADAAVINPADTAGLPFAAPAVFKPVHEGSSVGLHVCRDGAALEKARGEVLADMKSHPGRVYMLERAVLGGRELTVTVLDGRALAPIEIKPAEGVYDYQAKYFRDDTRYVVDPELPEGITELIRAQAVVLFNAIGGRHLARVDFILGADGVAYLLEVNTMPGFTSHSLVPKAAKHAGMEYAQLCEVLVGLAVGGGK